MVLGKLNELHPGAQIITKVKILDIRERETDEGSIFYTGSMVDKDGIANFITNVPLEKGKYYKIFGRVTDDKSIRIIERDIKGEHLPKEIPPIPDEELFNRGQPLDIKIPGILEISLQNIYVNYYCKTCKSIVEPKIKPRGLVYICKNCEEISPDDVDVKIKVFGKIHFGTSSNRFYMPHNTLEKIIPNVIDLLEEYGIDDTIRRIVYKLHAKTFLVRGFEGKEGNYIITDIEDI
ncbi:hypothetical protein ACPB8Q_04655 [Methanocaldococcus indicus]|uniref:hypothetical protein n=1 Tax=Methanocaldococcus indicus TaxID=213231 RepID=UPI003C6DA08E